MPQVKPMRKPPASTVEKYTGSKKGKLECPIGKPPAKRKAKK